MKQLKVVLESHKIYKNWIKVPNDKIYQSDVPKSSKLVTRLSKQKKNDNLSNDNVLFSHWSFDLDKKKLKE